MREIRYTSRFKRDYQREKSGRHGKTLDDARHLDTLPRSGILPLSHFSQMSETLDPAAVAFVESGALPPHDSLWLSTALPGWGAQRGAQRGTPISA